MSSIAQHLLNGLMQGTIYGLVAIGFTIFFGVMNVIKFSHGDVLAFGAFGGLVATWLSVALGLPIWLELGLVILTAVAASAAIGALIARSLVIPLKDAPPLNMLLMTMMLGTAIRECIRLFFPNGTNPQKFPELLPSGGAEMSGVYFRYDGLILICSGIAFIFAIQWIINRTRLGLAIRAVAEDGETARTMGINFTLTVVIAFAIGSMTAGFAGALFGLYYSEINYGMGLILAVIGFSAAIIGGLGNVWGAIVGGYLFAGLQTAVVATLPSLSDYKNVIAFIIVVALITWRPTGLLAERGSERV
ncbi:MAG TPA: branched-chain amino acid ABC transporter permease [Terriglobales bacterium]|nr:branched-chain amino acid ABC transporter permease [Terriglobales bacterium]